jgi:hypothetical protein
MSGIISTIQTNNTTSLINTFGQIMFDLMPELVLLFGGLYILFFTIYSFRKILHV